MTIGKPLEVENVATDAAKVVEGILLGFFKQTFPIHDCIDNSKIVIQDFEKAFTYFKSGKQHLNPKDIAEALMYAGDAIKKMPGALSKCKQVAHVMTEIGKIAHTFSNPVSFVVKVGLSILFHGREITQDIGNAVHYWDTKDFLHFGEMIGRIASITIAKPKNVVKDVGLVAEGLLFGFFKQSFPIQECIDDTKIVIDDFEKAYHYFKSGKEHLNPKDISEALKYAADAVKKFPAALSECESVAGIFGEIGRIVHTFSNPASFITKIGKSILFHGKEITHDLHDAVNFWEQKDFFHFGEKIGQIAQITIAKPQLNSESIAVIDFMEHYWFHAFGIHMQVDDCQSGISDSVEVINEVWSLIQLGHVA